MAKGFNRPAGGQGGMMQQIQRLQQQMAEAQERLAAETVSRDRRWWRGQGDHDRGPEMPIG